MSKKGIQLEQGLYIAGFIVFILGVPLLLYYVDGVDKGLFPSCVFYSRFGLYCFGCGGSRAVKALMAGDIFASLYYHPVVLYAAAIYGVFMISHTLHLISRGRIKGIQFHSWFLFGALIIIILNFIIKNVLKLGFHILPI